MPSSGRQPVIRIEKTRWHQVLEAASFALVLFTIIYTALSFSQLPEKLPLHFNLRGEADAYGSRAMIWLFPVLSAGLVLLLHALSKYPHTFNYAVPITVSNAGIQYRLAVSMMRVLNLVIAAMMAYLTYAIIQVAEGRQEKLGVWVMVLLVSAIFVPIAWYSYQSFKYRDI